MNISTLHFESISSEMLCALRFIDHVTGKQIRSNVQIKSDGLKQLHKSNGDVIIHQAESDALLEIVPNDPSYQSRLFTLKTPRSLLASVENSIYRAIEIALYPSVQYPKIGNKTYLNAVFLNQLTNAPIAGGLVRVSHAAPYELSASTVTNILGEALLVINGAPLLVQNGVGITRMLECDIDVLVTSGGPAPEIINPDEYEAQRAALQAKWKPAKIQLELGKTNTATVLMEPM